MEASALKMEGWFGFYINWWKYISNWLDIVSECSSSRITFDTKYQTFISINDWIPENVEDAMIVGWFSIVNSLKIYSYIGYEIWNFPNKCYFFCFTNYDFTFSRLVLKDGVIGISGAGSLFFKITSRQLQRVAARLCPLSQCVYAPQNTAPETPIGSIYLHSLSTRPECFLDKCRQFSLVYIHGDQLNISQTYLTLANSV